MQFSWNPTTKCTVKPQSSISTHPFLMFPRFQKYLNAQVKTSRLVNIVFLPPLSFKISLRDTSFHFSLKNACWIFWLLYSNMYSKTFSICGVHIVRKCIESTMHFYSCPHPPLKTPGRIFWKPVSQRRKGWRKLWFCSIKIQSENMKITWNIKFI